MIENIKMAFSSIFSNKMRSFLTMLGIIIGTAAVIAILAIGNGATSDISATLDNVIGTTITVSLSEMQAELSDYITLQDIEKIREVDYVRYVSPNISRSTYISSDDRTKLAVIYCGTPDLQYVGQFSNNDILLGTFFTNEHYENAQAVAVVDETTALVLFKTIDVVGKTIRIGESGAKQNIKIVGVLKSTTSFFGVSSDEPSNLVDVEAIDMPLLIYMPLTYAEVLFDEDILISSVNIKITDNSEVANVSVSVRQLLEKLHGKRNAGIYHASSFNMSDQINQIMDLVINFIAIVAAISLLVGGIGVMNIMLVSVTERTREIGIRKAIGASTGVVMFQFLTESVVISLFGGFIGFLIGMLLANILSSSLGIIPNIGINTILLVVSYSLAIGIFFGAYPAKKAANLDPIDALRYE